MEQKLECIGHRGYLWTNGNQRWDKVEVKNLSLWQHKKPGRRVIFKSWFTHRGTVLPYNKGNKCVKNVIMHWYKGTNKLSRVAAKQKNRVGPMESRGETRNSYLQLNCHKCPQHSSKHVYVYITQAGQWIWTDIVWEVSHETCSKFIKI